MVHNNTAGLAFKFQHSHYISFRVDRYQILSPRYYVHSHSGLVRRPGLLRILRKGFSAGVTK